MRQNSLAEPELKSTVARIHTDFKPVWDGLPEKDQFALAAYFLPRSSKQEFVKPIRPRLIKWYCPQACQKHFASGHRYCLNVYAGCDFGCEYCYAKGYSQAEAVTKKDFARLLQHDFADLNVFDVPPAPIHLSNCTDPFQPLEKIHGHARLALEGILEHRHRFSTVTILTKNPLLPVQGGYLDLFRSLGTLPGRINLSSRRRLTTTWAD